MFNEYLGYWKKLISLHKMLHFKTSHTFCKKFLLLNSSFKSYLFYSNGNPLLLYHIYTRSTIFFNKLRLLWVLYNITCSTIFFNKLITFALGNAEYCLLWVLEPHSLVFLQSTQQQKKKRLLNIEMRSPPSTSPDNVRFHKLHFTSLHPHELHLLAFCATTILYIYIYIYIKMKNQIQPFLFWNI